MSETSDDYKKYEGDMGYEEDTIPCEVKDGMVIYPKHIRDRLSALYNSGSSARSERLLSIGEVEDRIVGAIEFLTDYQFFDWAPVVAGLCRLQRLADKRFLELHPEKGEKP